MVNLNSISTNTVKPGHFEKIMKSAGMIQAMTAGINNNSSDSIQNRINRFIIGESRRFSKDVIKSSLSTKEKKNKIREISQNPELNKAVREYPKKEMPLVHYITLNLLMGNYYHLLKLLVNRS